MTNYTNTFTRMCSCNFVFYSDIGHPPAPRQASHIRATPHIFTAKAVMYGVIRVSSSRRGDCGGVIRTCRLSHVITSIYPRSPSGRRYIYNPVHRATCCTKDVRGISIDVRGISVYVRVSVWMYVVSPSGSSYRR